MMLEMLHVLEGIYQKQFNESPIFQQAGALQEGVKSKCYQTLMSRTKCSMYTSNQPTKPIIQID